MNAKLLFEALGEIDGAYVEQAAQYRGIAARRGLMKWGALAACLCLLAAVLIPALAAPPEPQSGGAAGSAGGAADAPPCVSAGGRRYYESTHPTVLDALPEGFSQSGTTDAGGAADCPYYLNPDAPYLLYVRQPVRQDGAAGGGTRTAFVRYVDERLRGRDLLSIDGALYISLWSADCSAAEPDAAQALCDGAMDRYGVRLAGAAPEGFASVGTAAFSGYDTVPSGALASNTGAAEVYRSAAEPEVALVKTHWYTAAEGGQARHDGFDVYVRYSGPLCGKAQAHSQPPAADGRAEG